MWWTLLREPIRDNGSSRASKFCCPLNARETKGESREARGGFRITCPRGIRGVTGVQRQRQNESNWTLGNSPRLTPSVHWYHAYPWTQTYNSLYLSLNTFSLRPLVLQIKPILHAFLSFFSRCTTLEYFFLFLNLIIYIKIWQVWYTLFCNNRLHILAPILT
jgi:hypothetical protein